MQLPRHTDQREPEKTKKDQLCQHYPESVQLLQTFTRTQPATVNNYADCRGATNDVIWLHWQRHYWSKWLLPINKDNHCKTGWRTTVESSQEGVWLIEHGLSPPAQYRLYGRRFLQVKRPTNSIKVLKEQGLARVVVDTTCVTTLTGPKLQSFLPVTSIPDRDG